DDDDDKEEETAKDDEELKETGTGGNDFRESGGESKEEKETSEEEERENDEFLRNIDENMKNVLKGLVKTQVKEQVSRILLRVEESVNAILEAEVLTRSSHSSRTSYAVAADLSEMELKKILIEKIEGNKREDDDQEGSSAGQTGGPKDKEKEVNRHLLALPLKRQPRVHADLQRGLNLDNSLPVSLLMQRNLCRLLVRWRKPHFRCMRQVQMSNQLFKHLSILNGSPRQGNHHHRIVLGTQLCRLLKATLNHG
nr:hypothetical protein [Tanacetum cinerariifolium]